MSEYHNSSIGSTTVCAGALHLTDDLAEGVLYYQGSAADGVRITDFVSELQVCGERTGKQQNFPSLRIPCFLVSFLLSCARPKF